VVSASAARSGQKTLEEFAQFYIGATETAEAGPSATGSSQKLSALELPAPTRRYASEPVPSFSSE
jgi:hypothetical protein